MPFALYASILEKIAEEKLLERLRILEATGADVLKLAVIPASTEDVMALLTATKAMAAQTNRPSSP